MNKKIFWILISGLLISFYCITVFSNTQVSALTALATTSGSPPPSSSPSPSPSPVSCWSNGYCPSGCTSVGQACTTNYINTGSCYNNSWVGGASMCCVPTDSVAGQSMAFGWQDCCTTDQVAYTGYYNGDSASPNGAGGQCCSVGAGRRICDSSATDSSTGARLQACCATSDPINGGADCVDNSTTGASCCAEIQDPDSGDWNSNIIQVNGHDQCGCKTSLDCVPSTFLPGNATDPSLAADCSASNKDGGIGCTVGPFLLNFPPLKDQETLDYKCDFSNGPVGRCIESAAQCDAS